jgi:2-polyprenyl-3-methyl-5-hydroxy-6-metoxy-1,4-benzoquinol methylase
MALTTGTVVRSLLGTRFSSLLHRAGVKPTLVPIARCANQQEFLSFQEAGGAIQSEMAAFELALLRRAAEGFLVPGWCAVCDTSVQFWVDYSFSCATHDDRPIPNWRERLVCPICGLNNRMRAAVTFLRSCSRRTDLIYLTEQTTSLFRAVARLYPNNVGSEFLRDGTLPGNINANGLRHEDVTHLTFQDASFDVIGSFDVLEHVPDFRRALTEFHRCLKPGGSLLLTVPFILAAPKTIARAQILEDGSIKHSHPPEYHGDPLSSEGVLCYYNFGWDLLDEMSCSGFVDPMLVFYWSKELGHLGGFQFVILAVKRKRTVETIPFYMCPPNTDVTISANNTVDGGTDLTEEAKLGTNAEGQMVAEGELTKRRTSIADDGLAALEAELAELRVYAVKLEEERERFRREYEQMLVMPLRLGECSEILVGKPEEDRMEDRLCPACGKNNGANLFSVASNWEGEGVLSLSEYNLLRCPDCETLFLSPEPPSTDLSAIYGHTQFTSAEYTDVAKVARAIDYYGSCVTGIAAWRGWSGPISVLEVGAGRAFMCLATKLVRPGSHTIAQDITDECAAVAPWVDRYQCVRLSDLEGDEVFHLVSLTHVIEHLVDPRAELKLIRGKLRNDGIVFVTAPHRPPDFRADRIDAAAWRAWSYNHVPAHVQYFSRDGLEALARRAGLVLERWDDNHEGGQAFEAWLRADK